MSVDELLGELDARGIEIGIEGGRLWYRPRSAVTPDLAERMKAGKVGLLAALCGEPIPETEAADDWDWWQQVKPADYAYLTGPRNYPAHCVWCGGRTRHSAACNELRAEWEKTQRHRRKGAGHYGQYRQ